MARALTILSRFRIRRRRRWSRCRPWREHVFLGFLFRFRALLDFDRPLKICSVFDHDLCCGQISVKRTFFLDLGLLGTDVTLHASGHDHFASNDVRSQFSCTADRKLPLIELNYSFYCPVDLEVFVPRDFAFDGLAWPD